MSRVRASRLARRRRLHRQALRESLDPRLETVDVITHGIDAGEQLPALGARHEIVALVRQVLRDVAHGGVRRAAPPVEGRARESRDPVGRNVADRKRELFLEIRPEESHQLAKPLRELSIAAQLNVAPPERPAGRTREREQREGSAAHARVGVLRAAVRDPNACPVAFDEEIRDVAHLDDYPAARELAAELPRTRRARQTPIEDVLDHRCEHGAILAAAVAPACLGGHAREVSAAPLGGAGRCDSIEHMGSSPPTIALMPHPAAPSEAVRSIEATAARSPKGVLILSYRIAGDLSRVQLPPTHPPRRADELWRHTCFEAFIAPASGPSYLELNFSPSSEWASYRFDGYREGRTNDEETQAPALTLTRAEGQMTIEVSVGVPRLRGAAPVSVALAAVIEESSGRLSYWALRHGPGKPDFHHPHGFTLQI